MIVYHATSLKKLNRYAHTRYIYPPVRAWKAIEQAERILALSDGVLSYGLNFRMMRLNSIAILIRPESLMNLINLKISKGDKNG